MSKDFSQEDVRKQLTDLIKANNCFYGRWFGSKSDTISLNIGERIFTIGYWRNDPECVGGFMVGTDDECEGLTGRQFATAQEAFDEVRAWAKTRRKVILPYRQIRE